MKPKDWGYTVAAECDVCGKKLLIDEECSETGSFGYSGLMCKPPCENCLTRIEESGV